MDPVLSECSQNAQGVGVRGWALLRAREYDGDGDKNKVRWETLYK